MRVVLGGTFSPLHNGHKALFQRAFKLGSGDKIIIGLTSDSMANAERSRQVATYSQRERELKEYLESLIPMYPNTRYEIIEINEVFNIPITQEIEADVFVVSEGRRHVAEETNSHREKCGKAPLEVIALPYVLAQDGLPIKATRIVNGEIDIEGRLLGTVKIAVGTENDVKLFAVENVFNKLYPDVELTKVPVSTGVRAQPWGAETISGAKNRAKSALEQIPGAHFGVGVEAGLFENESTGKCFDIQYCVIQDRGGRVTVGHGSGFYYPDSVLAGVKTGRTVGEVMSELAGIFEIGKKQGAIGFLSNGLLTRKALTEQAVLMALVPRITRLYD